MAYYLFSLNKGLILSNELKDPSSISNLKNPWNEKTIRQSFQKVKSGSNSQSSSKDFNKWS